MLGGGAGRVPSASAKTPRAPPPPPRVGANSSPASANSSPGNGVGPATRANTTHPSIPSPQLDHTTSYVTSIGGIQNMRFGVVCLPDTKYAVTSLKRLFKKLLSNSNILLKSKSVSDSS